MIRNLIELTVKLSLVGALAAGSAAGQDVEAAAAGALALPAPLLLEGDDSLDYEQQGQLDLGPSGTIEFSVAALWEEDPGYLPCVLASGRAPESSEPAALEQASRYGIYISADRSEIGMWNGRQWAAVPFDFSDGEYHHVAFVTEEGETEVLIDGEPQGLLEFGYGTPTGLPFHIGSSDGESDFFGGALQSVRLWDEALPDEMLAELASVHGAPGADHEAADLLLAFSSFTDQDQQLFFATGVQGRGALSNKIKQKLREKRAKNKAKRKEKRKQKKEAKKEAKKEKREARREKTKENLQKAGAAIKAQVKKLLRPPPALAPPQSDPPPVRRRPRADAVASAPKASSAPAPPKPRPYRRRTQAFHPALGGADGNVDAADRARRSRRRLKLAATPPAAADVDGQAAAGNLSSMAGRFQSAARQNQGQTP